MYRIFYADRDTTLYERYPRQNTGIDQILELTKIASGSKLNGVIQANSYNSRILLDFGTDQISTISSSITSGDMPDIVRGHPLSASAFLTIKAADATDLLQDYTIKAFPVSQSWTNGSGMYSDTPIQKYGASWRFRSSDDTADGWATGSAEAVASAGQTGSTEPLGGGSWMTGSRFEASQSFNNESPDIRMDVTDIVQHWLSGSIDNNGFMIKRPYSDESSGEVLGKLQFFGRETHTIFQPRLEILWNDTSLTTASLSEISGDTYVPYIKNIKPEYRTSEIAKFRVGVRPNFPSKTYQTSSFYLTGEILPTSSFYSILDSVTNETIMPFDITGSRIDCDSNGSFFKLRLESFMPERFYKIMLKVERDGGNDIQTFDDFYFKVVN